MLRYAVLRYSVLLNVVLPKAAAQGETYPLSLGRDNGENETRYFRATVV